MPQTCPWEAAWWALIITIELRVETKTLGPCMCTMGASGASGRALHEMSASDVCWLPD